MIIGTQKGGTTSLQRYMEKHPQIVPSYKKEAHYFDNKYHKSISWYKRHFPLSNKFNGKICGDSSPYYLFHPFVPQRIAKHLPDIKLIVLLREPVERAYSHYKMQYNKGLEKLSFEDAIKTEESRLDGSLEKLKNGNYSFEHQKFSYLSRGKYAEQLKRWFEYFDKDQILILRSEDLFSNTQQVLSEVFQFIGVEDHKLKELTVHNKGKKKSKLQESIKKELRDYYKPYNDQLIDLLDGKITW